MSDIHGAGVQTTIDLPKINVQLDREEVLKHVHRFQDEVVLLGGTLIEGIGNRLSDLDLYVVCDNRPLLGQMEAKHAFAQTRDNNLCTNEEDSVFLTTDFYLDSPHHLEVEYWTAKEVEALASQIVREHELLSQHADCSYTTGGISREAHLLVHRIRTGMILVAGSGFECITDSHTMMSSHILFRSVHNHYWAFQDIAGAADCGDWAMFRDQSREFLIREARAFTYASGNTNPTPKWLFSYLDALGANRDDSLLERVADHLLYGAKGRDHFAYASTCFALVDELETALRPILDDSQYLPSSQHFLDLLDAEETRRADSDGLAQRHELAFRRKSYTDAGPTYEELLKSI